VEPSELVAYINRRHQTSFALTGRLEGGTRGAHGLVDSAGRAPRLRSGWEHQEPCAYPRPDGSVDRGTFTEWIFRKPLKPLR
jgi:hypothetical protein